MSLHRWPTRALLALAILVPACSSSPATGSASVAAPSRASSTLTQPVSASPSDGVMQLTRSGSAALPPGTYTYDGFRPRIALTIGAGWVGADLFGDFFDVQVDPGSPDVVAVQLARPSAIHTSNAATHPPTTPEAAVAALAGNPIFDASPPTTVTVDGRPGQRITISATRDAAHAVMEITAGTLSILGGRRLEVTFVAADDGTLLALMIGGSIAQWNRAQELGRPVADSVRIGP